MSASQRFRDAYRKDMDEADKMALLIQYHAQPDPLCTEDDDDNDHAATAS